MTTKTVFIVVQEGGSSTELYANAYDTVEEAQEFRESCGHDGAYRTTPPVEVPEGMAQYVSEISDVLISLSKLEVVDDG